MVPLRLYWNRQRACSLGRLARNVKQSECRMEPTRNLPHARYRRFQGMREYEAVIDELIPQTQSRIRIFDRSLSRAYNSP